jgi:hypothetical protein
VAPTILSYSRALLSAAKELKTKYWATEVAAAILAVSASVLPWPRLAAVAGVCSVVAKVLSKLTMSASKRLFRAGERARRYDFYARTLGWPVPSRERADMVVTKASTRIEEIARKFAATESDYYAHRGLPSTERLLCNLTEAMFWTERLMGAMAKIRWKHLVYAGCAVGAVLIGTLVLQPPVDSLLALKYLGAAVALLVAIDILGEAQSFERGEREAGRLLGAVTVEMARATPSRDEALRLLIEYNCLLADLPILPDSVYLKNRDLLNTAWAAFEESLPIRCSQSST